METLNEEKKIKISGLFLVGLSLFPILRPALQSILIIVFCIISVVLYHKNFLRRIRIRKLKITFLCLTSYYIWHVFSSFWSEEVFGSLADAQSNCILLLFPIVFLFFHPPIPKLITIRVQLGFVLAMLIYLFLWYRAYLLGVSYYQIIKLEELPVIESSFLNQIEYFLDNGFYMISGTSIRGYRLANEEMKLFVHHNYVASYFVLALYSAINLIFTSKKIICKFLLIISSFLFLVIIFYLPSKMNQLVLLASIPILIFYIFEKKLALTLVLVGIVSCCFVFYNYQEKLVTVKLVEKENLTSKDPSIIDFYRYHVYNCITDKIPENLLFGMGKGDVQPFLNSCLPDDEWPGLSNEKIEYNTHSQALSYLISGGIIGFLLFIIFWIKLFSLAFSKERLMFIIFLIVIFANTIFENYLTRVWGSFIFAFFTFIFLKNDFIEFRSKKSNENQKLKIN
ncbi:MAG: O-antigen ligase family protein [Maribacter stanieri]